VVAPCFVVPRASGCPGRRQDHVKKILGARIRDPGERIARHPNVVVRGIPMSISAADQLLAATRTTQAGTFEDVRYVQYDGIFQGETSTGAFVL